MFIFAHTINKQMEQMTKKNCQNRIRVVLVDIKDLLEVNFDTNGNIV